MEPEEVLSAYLVLVRVNLLGGKEVIAVDAFRAEDEATASNYARNLFLRSGGEAVVYGSVSFFAGTIGSVEAEVIGVLEQEHPSNAGWITSMDTFDAFLEREERREQLLQRDDQS